MNVLTILKVDELWSTYKTYIVYPNGSKTCLHGSHTLLESNKWITSNYGKKVISNYLNK